MKALKILVIAIFGLFVLAFVGMKISGISPVGFGMHDAIQQSNDKAIGGYDPVAYFTQGEAVMGNHTICTEWEGSTWCFASEEHKNMFVANPEQYVPACGGHCVLAASTGFAAPGNPESWSIEDGQLYFYSGEEIKQEVQKNIEAVKSGIEEKWN